MFKTNFKCLLCLSHDRVINFLILSRQIAFVQNPEIQEFLLFWPILLVQMSHSLVLGQSHNVPCFDAQLLPTVQ